MRIEVKLALLIAKLKGEMMHYKGITEHNVVRLSSPNGALRFEHRISMQDSVDHLAKLEEILDDLLSLIEVESEDQANVDEGWIGHPADVWNNPSRLL